MHHGLANRITFPVQKPSMDEVIIKSVEQENESNRRVNVNDDESQHSCHDQLLTVDCHGPDDCFQLRETVNDIEQMN